MLIHTVLFSGTQGMLLVKLTRGDELGIQVEGIRPMTDMQTHDDVAAVSLAISNEMHSREMINCLTKGPQHVWALS